MKPVTVEVVLALPERQSLRRVELEKRREIGIIINDMAVVTLMRATFLNDWLQTDSGWKQAKKDEKREKKIVKFAKAS